MELLLLWTLSPFLLLSDKELKCFETKSRCCARSPDIINSVLSNVIGQSELEDDISSNACCRPTWRQLLP